MQATALSVPVGNSRVFNLHLYDDLGADLDITGWTVYFTVKRSIKDTDALALIQKDVTVHTDPTHGLTAITLVPADTSSLTFGRYLYDIRVKTLANSVVTVAHGYFTLEEGVTQRSST